MNLNLEETKDILSPQNKRPLSSFFECPAAIRWWCSCLHGDGFGSTLRNSRPAVHEKSAHRGIKCSKWISIVSTTMSWNWSQEKAKYFCWPRTAKIMGEFFFSHSFFSYSQCWCFTGSRLIFRILSFQLSILDRHILVASQKGWLPKLQTANITIQILIKKYFLKKHFVL